MPYIHDQYQYPATQQTQCACCSDNHLIVSICEPGVTAVRQTKGRAELRERCCSFSTRRKWLKIIFCVSTLLCFFHLTSASCVWCIVIFCLFLSLISIRILNALSVVDNQVDVDCLRVLGVSILLRALGASS